MYFLIYTFVFLRVLREVGRDGKGREDVMIIGRSLNPSTIVRVNRTGE